MYWRAKRSLVFPTSVMLFVLIAAVGLSGCGAPGGAMRPKAFLHLPDSCNTPDGMTLCDKTGTMYLSCPNFKYDEFGRFPALVMQIDKSNKASLLCELPVLAETGHVGPMGLDIGPDGNLYIADNQFFYNKDYKSRLLRVNMKDGKAVGTDVVVTGFKLSNAVIWRDDAVYVSDTFFDIPGKPNMSGIFRIKLSEMAKGTVQLKPGLADPHLIATFTTVPNHRGDTAGADGLTFDGDGNLYCGNFGDGVISKITFDKNGKVTSNKKLIADPRMPSADGMFWDKKRNLIFIADSERNAVRAFTPEGKLHTVWENGDTDGSDGLLDQPCEVIVRGDELIVVCFDLTFPGLINQFNDRFHTLSVIQLKP